MNRTRRNIGALTGFSVVAEYYRGKTINEISDLFGVRSTYISQIVGAYFDLQKIIQENRPISAPIEPINPSEFDLLLMTDEQFYTHTALPPDNRWWVGKGQNVEK